MLEIIKSNLFLLTEDCLTNANENAEENTIVWSKNCYIVTQELLLAFSVYQVTWENQFSIKFAWISLAAIIPFLLKGF